MRYLEVQMERMLISHNTLQSVREDIYSLNDKHTETGGMVETLARAAGSSADCQYKTGFCGRSLRLLTFACSPLNRTTTRTSSVNSYPKRSRHLFVLPRADGARWISGRPANSCGWTTRCPWTPWAATSSLPKNAFGNCQNVCLRSRRHVRALQLAVKLKQTVADALDKIGKGSVVRVSLASLRGKFPGSRRQGRH